ncbi:MAG: MFS transporter [Taibaiella sp.]|nr:MFS transporter [Taibaiella sp.]
MRFCIILALNMQATIVSYYVYKLTFNPVTHKGDALVLGLMGLWEVIPAIGFSLFSGHFVDISEKKKLLTCCIGGYLLLTLYFIMLSLPATQGHIDNRHIIWCIYGGIFAGGALRAFISPASFALMGILLPRKLYTNATTWSSTAWQAGFVIGPLLGGLLIAAIGFSWSQVCTGAIELVALSALLLIPAQPVLKKVKEPILKSLSEGIKFVFSTQLILAALSLDMFAVLFGGAVALLPVFANEILKTGEVGFGWMRAAPGMGSIVMLMLLSAMPLRHKAGIKLLLALAGFGLSTIVFGLSGQLADTGIIGTFMGCNISPAFLLAFFMLLLGGAFDSVSVVIRSTVLQLYTPDSMRGRVAAVNTMFISSSNELGAMESGITARWMGAVPAVVMGGCLTLLVVGITYVTSPLLRVLKLEPPDTKN